MLVSGKLGDAYVEKVVVSVAGMRVRDAWVQVTPELSDATGEEHSEIMIKDVVQRVKCELSEAFDKKVEQREFLWLAGWTAHADLTLQVNDNAGVSPNGTYTKALGSTSTAETLAGKPLSSVVSTFALGVSANLNGQAVRSETVSFTVALDELKMWRRQLDKMEAGLPPEKKTCNFGGATGVTGNLGLQEWVDSAFYPGDGGAAPGRYPSRTWRREAFRGVRTQVVAPGEEPDGRYRCG